ncbi:hypothetical protein PaeBR_08540 [Paenibacillus sp. BR2-3]|uniref:hypothetical protein n=1 Tax=Paenibacillus sp. BR2-3 TaxID=3048494 RepID=UPI00397775A8
MAEGSAEMYRESQASDEMQNVEREGQGVYGKRPYGLSSKDSRASLERMIQDLTGS